MKTYYLPAAIPQAWTLLSSPTPVSTTSKRLDMPNLPQKACGGPWRYIAERKNKTMLFRRGVHRCLEMRKKKWD